MLDNFVGAKRDGTCGLMGDRYINRQSRSAYSINIGNRKNIGNSNNNSNSNNNNNSNNNTNSSILLIYANNLYGYAMMQKLPCKDFE